MQYFTKPIIVGQSCTHMLVAQVLQSYSYRPHCDCTNRQSGFSTVQICILSGNRSLNVIDAIRICKHSIMWANIDTSEQI